VYLILMFGRVILSWFPIAPGTAMASVFSLLYAVTEPILGPIRRVIPPMGVGGMGLDLSPIIVFFALTIVRSIVCS
jgi:YggT family protein